MFVKLSPFETEINRKQIETQRGVWLDSKGSVEGVSVQFQWNGETINITFQWPGLEMESYCQVDAGLVEPVKRALIARKDETMRLLTERLAMKPEVLFDMCMQYEDGDKYTREDAMGFLKREFGINCSGSEGSSLCLLCMKEMKLRYDDLKALVTTMRQYPEFQYVSDQILKYVLKHANGSVPALVERLHEKFNEECEDGPNNEWDPDKNPDYEYFLMEQYTMY